MQQKVSQVKPIQMVKFDEKKNIYLTQQAIDIFDNLQSKQLCIVCVAGKYRTGKSYILNRVLLQQNNGFQVGPTINACTKGLWMWPQIVKINFCGHQKQCVVIDTQGLGSLEQGQNTDMKIFLMATLLSSYLIYNSVGSIDQKAVESLNLVVNMANLLQRNGDKFDTQELINSFPSFMWLVRDFSLRLQNQNGQKISSQQYLQNALKQQKGKSIAVQRKNQIRKQLKTFFQQRDCFTLIRPTLNERDLQNLSTLPEKRLRPQFVELISELKKRIHFGIQPKKIRGKSMTPQGFIELCNYYVSNINSGKLPSINSHWDNLCINQSGRLIKKYQMRLKQYVEAADSKDESFLSQQLYQFYQKLYNQANQTVEKSFLGKLQKKLIKQKLQKTLKEQLNQIYEFKSKSEQQQIQNQIKQIFCNFDASFSKLNQEDDSNVKEKDNRTDLSQKIDIFKKIFQQFKKVISEPQNKNNLKHSCLNQNNNSFVRKMYDLFFTEIQHKFNTFMEQQFLDLIDKNVQMSQKLKKFQKECQKRVRNQKNCTIDLKNQMQESQRKLNQSLGRNKYLVRRIEQLQLKNTQQHQNRSQLNIKIEYQKQIHLQTVKKLQGELKRQLKLKMKTLQQKLQQSDTKKQSLWAQVRELQIKQRKNIRQCEIYKQKLMQMQKQNAEVSKQNQVLKSHIARIQREKRNLIRKGSSRNFNYTYNGQISGKSLRQMIAQSTQLQCKQGDSQTDRTEHQQSQQIECSLRRINDLQIESRKFQQQSKHIHKLYNEQRSLNQLLIQAPQTMNYQSLKKNYELEKHNSKQLSKKVKQYQAIFMYVGRIECCICKELINKKAIFANHCSKCLANNKKQIMFDVSYVYNNEGQLNFLFEIQTQERGQQNMESLERQGMQKISEQTKWQVTKTLKSVKNFLKRIQMTAKDIQLFSELDNLKQLQNINQSEQKINLNEQRRLYLDDLCHNLKNQLWKRNQCIQFFALDLHLLREKAKSRKPSIKKKKIGLLNLDLGQIIEQPNQNDNSLNFKNDKNLSESVNLMKTAKFSMRKVFKFGPNI